MFLSAILVACNSDEPNQFKIQSKHWDVTKQNTIEILEQVLNLRVEFLCNKGISSYCSDL